MNQRGIKTIATKRDDKKVPDPANSENELEEELKQLRAAMARQRKTHQRLKQENARLNAALAAAEAEAAVRDNLLQRFVDGIPHSITLKSPDGRYVIVNEYAARTNNWTTSDIIGKTASDLIANPMSKTFDDMFAEVMATGKPIMDREEPSRRSKNVWYSISVFPVFGGNGMVEFVVTSTIQITEKKKAELELKEQREMLQVLIDNIPARISLRDADRRFLLVNQVLAENIGRPVEEIVGKTNEEIYGTAKTDTFEKFMDRVFETGEPSLDMEFVTQREPDLILLQNMVPVKASGGQVEKLALITTDITARKEAEKELAQHRDHLAALVEERTRELEVLHKDLLRNERLATIGDLTASVSHELRNPLGTISSSFYSIKAKLGKEAPVYARPLDRIDRSINRCTRLIEQLLEYTQPQSSHFQKNTIEDWGANLLRHVDIPIGVTLRSNFPAELEATFDPVLLGRAMEHLVENACQAAADAHPQADAGCVQIDVCQVGDLLEIGVTDNGPGIPDTMKTKIFEPLFSTKIYGVGLGLPLVQKIVELHGGSIEARNRKGTTGAAFIIKLPLADEVAAIPVL